MNIDLALYVSKIYEIRLSTHIHYNPIDIYI